MLKYQTISPEQRRLLEFLAEKGIFERFYLAGGTGLALQLGQRKSVDLDLFTPDAFDADELMRLWAGDFTLELRKDYFPGRQVTRYECA